MADESFVSITPGSGADIGSVDIGGVQVQKVLAGNHVIPRSFERITDASSSTALPTIPEDAVTAFLQVEGGSIRWRPDATAPTTSVGMLVPAGYGVELPFGTAGLADVRLIAASGSPIISIVYA